MMERLREQTSSPDPVTARAALLVSAMPPLEVDRLPRPPAAPRSENRAPTYRFRMMLVVAMSLGSVAAAAATLHRVGWLGAPGGTSPTLTSPQSQADSAMGPRLPDHGGGSAAAEPLPAAPGVVDMVGTVPPVGDTGSPTSLRATHPASRHKAATDSSPGGAVGAGQDESALIVNAVRALRHDGDPTRAQSLAEEALQRYPHGMQVEEAMALAMDAAFARGDVAGARRAAQRYLQRFGGGRFADRAQRILAALER
jgi:hypothetical protein